MMVVAWKSGDGGVLWHGLLLRELNEQRSTAREIEASQGEDCGGKIPNAGDKNMRGWSI
jgi:hypothetical protein